MTRVVLLSDGQANHGLLRVEDIVEQVSALAGAGVTTTTVGLGRDFNEELMGAMACAGQGGQCPWPRGLLRVRPALQGPSEVPLCELEKEGGVV